MNRTPEPCPFCGSHEIKDCYVFVKCLRCGAEGPYTNGKRYDDHADFRDHVRAIELWNTRADQTGGRDG